MEAEIITIGTELLLGEIVDTNTRYIAHALREIGLDLYRTSTVGDNAERIAQAVHESVSRAQVVITSGGLGPTVDDATREGIAQALDLPMEFRPELWKQIEDRFALFGFTPTENNRRQANLPKGAKAIDNPIGTAPGFIVDAEESVVIALPGVPAEMKLLLETDVIPYLIERLRLTGVIKTRLLRTAGVGESWLDDHIQDLEHISNPSVGLAAHPGRVDIRITAKAADLPTAEEMIGEVEAAIRQRLGDAIYGIDDESLEAAALSIVEQRGWRMVVTECGTNGALASGLSQLSDVFAGGKILPQIDGVEDLEQALMQAQTDHSAEIGLGLTIGKEAERFLAVILLRTPDGEVRKKRYYGGPPAYAAKWAVSAALDLIRRRLA